MRNSSIKLLLTSFESILFFTPYFDSKGIPWEKVAKKFGLPIAYSDEEVWVPVKTYSMFLNHMAAICDNDMPIVAGKHAAQTFIDGKWGIIKQGSGFKQVISSMMENANLFSRQNEYWFERFNGSWCWCNRSGMKPSYPGSAVNEWFRLSLLTNICRNWLGNEWSPKSVSVMTSESQGNIYAEILLPNVEVRYGQPSLKLELEGVDDLQPMSNHPLCFRDLGDIEKLSDSYCHLPNFTLEWLASLFGVTSKTLYRYFKDHNTSFNQIKKKSILNRTCLFLSETEYPISEIAYRMGYKDVSNFNRAIKSISGATPAQLRRNLSDLKR
ncbi:AraC family transcriptional regulator [Photobacterium rosenbergii]|uniref:AraC family transcriptional regulator n=1 Tax=Photobacterium rosenbergii TaxID=294936 RepID=A0A2T3NI32_9GAMM|nr:AraC family transcriptional regulator [Photobacterium rosenbergii]PSW14613.1 AraC family transcriptional regulator [Photobacterium rosenbergii]